MENINCPVCKNWVGVLVNMPKNGIQMKCQCGHAWYIGLSKTKKKKAKNGREKHKQSIKIVAKRSRKKKRAS
ncbi:MAG: hypothetical protein ACM3UZ_15965 [Acidobacteriota bacterium]